MAVIKSKFLSTYPTYVKGKACYCLMWTTYEFNDTPIDLSDLKEKILKLNNLNEFYELIESVFKYVKVEEKYTKQVASFTIDESDCLLNIATTKIINNIPNLGGDRCVVWQNDLIYMIFNSINLNDKHFNRFLDQIKKADPTTKYFDDYLNQLNFIFEYDIDFKTIFYKLKLDKIKIPQKQIKQFLESYKNVNYEEFDPDTDLNARTSQLNNASFWLLKNLKTKWQKEMFEKWCLMKNININNNLETAAKVIIKKEFKTLETYTQTDPDDVFEIPL